MKKILLFVVLGLGLVSNSAHALFELKAGGGVVTSKPDLGKIYTTGSIPSASATAGLTLDAVAFIPFVGLGAGLRTEDMKVSYSNSSLGVENSMKRTAMILSYRLIDTMPIYLGPIVTYGLSHSNSLKITAAGTKVADISSSSVSSYSLGLEGGVKLLGFMVGAEFGTMAMTYKDATDSVSHNKADLDMTGPYAKIFVGFGI